MPNAILSLLLSMQLCLCSTGPRPSVITTQPLSLDAGRPAQELRLWWGMIDPELAAWFARLPIDGENEDKPVLWDWSWRGFLAALWDTFQPEEDHADAQDA